MPRKVYSALRGGNSYGAIQGMQRQRSKQSTNTSKSTSKSTFDSDHSYGATNYNEMRLQAQSLIDASRLKQKAIEDTYRLEQKAIEDAAYSPILSSNTQSTGFFRSRVVPFMFIVFIVLIIRSIIFLLYNYVL